MSATDRELREIFAGLAMNGLLSGQINRHADDVLSAADLRTNKDETFAENIAKDAVAHADALIRALGYDLVSR